MLRPIRVSVVLILTAVIGGACAGGSGSGSTPIAPSDSPAATPSAEASDSPAATDPNATDDGSGSPTATPPGAASPGASSAPTGPAVATPAWANIPLTDVRTGETFTLAGAGDRVVFVEPMAVWCSSCRQQQETAKEAVAALDPTRVIWVALDVDPNETPEMLARFADENEFPFTYAVAGVDLSRALADAFGAQVLSPPSTPVIVIGTDGTVTLTEFGHKSQDRILELAQQHGA
ncbi:MAG: redoxin domain-containing protein [Chloroflexota bacterium]|nr:redoxin domain-containing protein [Chloroflexota bacterium]